MYKECVKIPLFSTGQNLLKKIIYGKVTYSKFSAAKVEGYIKSGKVKL